ncbi:MgtC/SapB family protein (plasmid) [Geminicoccaceae bacterium 1502E]|nr:MgtC/SapB family protein [Geminicoccaceae bacterium 1502E]
MDALPDSLLVWWASLSSALDVAGRLGVAALCGAALGLDRELRDKPLGLRTYMLVSLGAGAFSILTLRLVDVLGAEEKMALDPTRVIEGVIGGIGFLGAGAIIQGRGRIRGATTGAGIWVVGAIGMAAGFGLYMHAIVFTALAVCIMTVLGVLSARLHDALADEDETKGPRPMKTEEKGS